SLSSNCVSVSDCASSRYGRPRPAPAGPATSRAHRSMVTHEITGELRPLPAAWSAKLPAITCDGPTGPGPANGQPARSELSPAGPVRDTARLLRVVWWSVSSWHDHATRETPGEPSSDTAPTWTPTCETKDQTGSGGPAPSARGLDLLGGWLNEALEPVDQGGVPPASRSLPHGRDLRLADQASCDRHTKSSAVGRVAWWSTIGVASSTTRWTSFSPTFVPCRSMGRKGSARPRPRCNVPRRSSI